MTTKPISEEKVVYQEASNPNLRHGKLYEVYDRQGDRIKIRTDSGLFEWVPEKDFLIQLLS